MRFTHGTGVRGAPSFRKRTVAAGAAIALTATGLFAMSTANAAGDASLPGSNFEIEEDANLVLNSAAPSIDWLTAAKTTLPGSTVQDDKTTGKTDDSYSGGTKEDSVCPDETTGSIPNNKSDLKQFRVYREAGTGSLPGFLNLAWSRVTDPSGTTLMDFEFNQSKTKCAQGPNVLRTSGDLLIEYYIDQGGKRANIFKRTWTGAEWGPAQNLSDPNPACAGASCAVGTINQSAIAAADSGTGTPQSQYTFGEASIDLRTIFEPGKCTSFGSAMLKSRSSDSFTSQLKDFIAPVPISLTNCGKVIIRKQTDPDKQAGIFDFVKAFSTDETTTNAFSLSDDGVQTFDNVLFGSGLTVQETNLPSGFSLKGIDCSASTAVTPTISLAEAKVTFAIDSDSDVLDCTYTNEAKAKFTVKKVLDPATSAETFGFTTALTPNNFTLGHNATQVFSNLAPGSVSVTETTKTGWDLMSVICTKTNSGSGATATVTLAAGDDVTCTYTNRQRAQIVIVKVDDTGAPLVGAGFTASATGQPNATCTTALVDHDNDASTPDRAQCTLSNLVPNVEYTVSETTVPTGYQKAADQKVTPTPGQTVTLTFTDNRLFKVIAFVCQESDNTLYNGSANVNSQGAKATTSAVPAAVQALLDAGVTQAQIQAALCGLDAKFPGLTAGTYSGSVTIN